MTPPPPDYHGEAEIAAAFEALTDDDICYIVGFIRFRILGLRGKADEADADDLFSEAVLQTKLLKRKWRKGSAFAITLSPPPEAVRAAASSAPAGLWSFRPNIRHRRACSMRPWMRGRA